MRREVFDYRKCGIGPIAVFLFVWGGLASLIGVLGLIAPTGTVLVKINHQTATPGQAAQFLWCALAVGLVVVAAGTVAAMCYVNCNVTVANGSVTWFNWLGKPIVTGPLAGAEFLPDEEWGGSSTQTIRTSGGDIRVRLLVDRYGVLWSLITGKDRVLQRASYVPAAQTFKTWGQIIHIGPDGISEHDSSGNVRLKASLDQIVAVAVLVGNGGTRVLIHTTVGTIRTSFNMAKSDVLGREVRQLVDSRKGMAAVPIPG